ncbi:hypothetical protein [Streptomyces sp. NPDC051662]|uniref:hypothetical protein n=1 Tax=Streptomyces sp. NPDC051662 TaxID=3154750 RepID=UPI0034290BF6
MHPEALATDLVTTMLTNGALGRIHATADHTPVAAEALRVPYPRARPTTEPH